jgi:hypothetical protein
MLGKAVAWFVLKRFCGAARELPEERERETSSIY